MISKTLAVILAGGSGTRLWPLSRSSYPKQFLDITNSGFSLLQTTIKRAIKLSEAPVIIGNFEHRFIISEQLRQIGAENCKIILEPGAKNTLPVAIIAALEGLKKNCDTIVFLPSDHIIKNEEKFSEYLKKACDIVLQNKKILTFGLKPTSPHTGYGYIEKAENSNEIVSFHEKPNIEKANEYIKRNNFLWNSGMFVFSAQTMLNEVENFAPRVYKNTELAYNNAKIEYQYLLLNKEYFDNIDPISIDHGIMEKTKKSIVIECEDFGWSDVGEFKAIYDLQNKDNQGNVVLDKNIVLHNTKNSYIVNKSNNKLVVSDMENVLIVSTQDTTMVANLKNSCIKDLVNKLISLKFSEISDNCFEYRPWGRYDNLFETDKFKIKKITVLPQKQLSLQLHHERSEHWIVISGFAEIWIGENILNLTVNESVYIPVQTKHRVKNISEIEDLVFIEVQTGSYFGEDDIIRFEDNFGRV